jgi:metal-sulfur cluster biosynthetic enzyme
MITKEEIVEILKGVTHPETGKNLIEEGIAQRVDFE